VLSKLRNYPNFKLLEEGILDFSPGIKKAVLITKDSDTYIADYIFQSVITPESAKSKNLKYPLIQHFYGMEIRTPRPVFDPATFTIMDVDENFDDGFAFIYVLPFKANQALIEYTVFSANPLKKKEYRKKIRTYLKKKFGFTKKDLKVIRKEGGRIPMDDRPFEPQLEQNIFNIGTVGGFTKPSTGYAFSRTHQFTKSLAKSLIENGKPVLPATSARRFRYYDKLLLHILATSAYNSRRTFHHLFKNNSIDLLFDFLNEDTTFSQDLRVMASVPYRPFLQAISKNII
jgi:lycopene beta-cyclase